MTAFIGWSGVRMSKAGCLLLAISTLLGACSSPEADLGSVSPEPDDRLIVQHPAPTAAELASATYGGILDQPVTLVDGRWEGEPFTEGGSSRPAVGRVKDFYLVGDLDGDRHEEAVALLWSSSGGSGTFDYLAVMDREEGRIVNRDTVELGDRVDIRSYTLDVRRLIIEVIQAGPDDPRCCPGEKARRVWEWTDGGLHEVSSETLGRLSVADLGGVEWVLERFAWNEPQISEPQITLIMRESTLTGSSGCNRYHAPVDEGDLPGDLTIGPIAHTSKTCTEAIDAVEARFLRALDSTNRFSFMVGKLVLSWNHDERWETMVFAPHPLETRPGP